MALGSRRLLRAASLFHLVLTLSLCNVYTLGLPARDIDRVIEDPIESVTRGVFFRSRHLQHGSQNHSMLRSRMVPVGEASRNRTPSSISGKMHSGLLKTDVSANIPPVAMFLTYFQGYSADILATMLSTCALSSPRIKWFIVTDQSESVILQYYPKPWPRNVEVIFMKIEQLNAKLEPLFGYDPKLTLPSHIQNIRASFGSVFQEELREFEYWGWSSFGYLLGDLHSVLINARIYSALSTGKELWVEAAVAVARNKKEVNDAFLGVMKAAKSVRNVPSIAESTVLKWRGAQPRAMRFGLLRKSCYTAVVGPSDANMLGAEGGRALPSRWVASQGVVYSLPPRQDAAAMKSKFNSSMLSSYSCKVTDIFSPARVSRDEFGAMETTNWLLRSAALYFQRAATIGPSRGGLAPQHRDVGYLDGLVAPMLGQYENSMYILTSCSHAIRVSPSDARQTVPNGLGSPPMYPTYNSTSSPIERVPADMQWWCETVLAAR